MANTYVIGLSRKNLLQIEWAMNWNNGVAKIQTIRWGVRFIDEATLIPEEKMAYETPQEIKDNYKNICVFAPSVLEACVYGDDIDVNSLHIYEVKLGREIC